MSKSHFYDGDGLRVSRKDNVSGITTYYVWDTENPTGYPQVTEEIENNQVVRRYGYGLFFETIDIKNGTEFERFYVVRDGTLLRRGHPFKCLSIINMRITSAVSKPSVYLYSAVHFFIYRSPE